jgi:hypothetical protein
MPSTSAVVMRSTSASNSRLGMGASERGAAAVEPGGNSFADAVGEGQ